MIDALDVFRENVISKLKELNWSQAELARRAKIAQPSMNIYFAKDKEKQKDPNVKTCQKIASTLGIPLSDLFRRNAVIKPNPPHTLEDCFTAIAKAKNIPVQVNILQPPLRHTYTPTQKQVEMIPNELWDLLAQLDPEMQKRLPQEWLASVKIIVGNYSKKKKTTSS